MSFLRNSHYYQRDCQRKSVIPTQQAKFETKKPVEQQQTMCGTSNDCKLCIQFRIFIKMRLFQQPNRAGNNGAQLIIIKKQ